MSTFLFISKFIILQNTYTELHHLESGINMNGFNQYNQCKVEYRKDSSEYV